MRPVSRQHEGSRSELAKRAAILDALPATIAMIDSSGTIVSVNDAWRRFALANGMPEPARGPGRNYLEVCDNAVGPEAAEIRRIGAGIRSVLAGDEDFFSVEYACHSPAEERWFFMTVTPLADGASGGAVVMHVDVTVRRRAEEAMERTMERLQESEVRYRALVDWSPEAVAVTRDGRILFMNPAAVRLMGAAREEELVGRPMSDFIDPDAAGLAGRRTQNVRGAVAPLIVERLVRLDGTVIDVELQSRSLIYGDAPATFSSIRDVTERKKVEDQLRASDQKFQQLADHLTDAFWIRSADMKTVHYISPAFERIWGRPVDVLYNEPLSWPTFILEEDREYALSSFAALTTGVTNVDIEYRIVRPDGNIRWIRARAFQMRNEEGVVVRNIGIATDITEKHRVTEALRASNAEQRQLAQQLEVEKARLVAAQQVAKVGSWELDLETMAVLWSAETHRIFETDPNDAVTHELFLSRVHPEDRAAVHRALMESRDQRGPCSIEHRVLLADGRVRFIEERWHFTLDERGQPVRAVGTCQDISDRKLAEISVESARRRLRDIIDGLGPSMFVGLLTPEGILVEINRPALEAAGLKAEDVLGRPFAETLWWAISPDVQEQLREAIVRAAQGEASRYDVRVGGADGSVVDLDFSLQPLRDDTGKVVFLIPSASVVTERKRAEGALRQAQKMEAVGQLAAGVAHEFNNILQTLLSMATITRLRGMSPEMVKIAGEMEAQIRRGASITRQLLVVSHKVEMTRKSVDLRAQVGIAHDLLRRLMPENIEIVVEVTDEQTCVEGDEGQLQQVLLNLAINARDAMPRGGRLTLRVAARTSEAILEVEDNGEGIDEKTRERIFEPFFTTKDVGQGSGLGLSVVYGIIEQLGGTIEVSSAPGVGTLFRVVLPRTSDEPSAVEVAADAQMPGNTGSILLVEDEAGVREGLTLLLQEAGYQVRSAGSAEEALRLPLSPAPDLLLSDVSLPGMGGPSMARLLRKRWPSVRVVLMTGYIAAGTREVSIEEGWNILQKPFDFDALINVLAEAMAQGTSGRNFAGPGDDDAAPVN